MSSYIHVTNDSTVVANRGPFKRNRNESSPFGGGAKFDSLGPPCAKTSAPASEVARRPLASTRHAGAFTLPVASTKLSDFSPSYRITYGGLTVGVSRRS